MRGEAAVAAAVVVVLSLGAPAQSEPGTALHQGTVGETFAGAQTQFDLVTHGDDQYLAYFDVDRDIVVKHRTLGVAEDGPWSTTTIPETSYNPDGRGRDHSFRSRWDSHNWLRLAVDGSGRLHLAGDMHGSEIRYWRTSTAGDLGTLTRRKVLVDPRLEDRVTYPEFILRPRGNLGWLMFRDGASGRGRTYVYAWDDQRASWSSNGRLFQATSTVFGDGNGNAYTEVFPTPGGDYHVLYSWRETPNSSSSSRFSYVRTRDFRTYENARGLAVPTPVNAAARRPIVDPLPAAKDASGGWASNGFINGETLFGVSGDRILLAYTKLGRDRLGATSKQIWVASRSGTQGAWDVAQVTEEPGGVGLVGATFPDNHLVVVDHDTVAIDFRYDARVGRPTRRVTFDPSDLGDGPFPSTDAPAYYPAEVYRSVDAFPGATSHTEADSRSHEQAGGTANRGYLNSRPADARTLYVVSWLAGPDRFTPPDPIPGQEVLDGWPARPLEMFRITY